MVRTLIKALGKVLFKIGLAASTERFVAKLVFDLLHWLAKLNSNPLAVERVQELEDIYNNKGGTYAHDIDSNNCRKATSNIK